MKKRIALIMSVLILMAGLVSCRTQSSSRSAETTITGIPLTSHWERLSAVIKTDSGHVFCYGSNNWNTRKFYKALAIISSEIEDNDDTDSEDRLITFKGYFNGDDFIFSSVSANGMTVSRR